MGGCRRPRLFGNVVIFFQDARHEPPMADGPHHVLADAEGDKCIVLEERIPAILGRIDRLLQPSIPQRECFVASKFWRGFMRNSAYSWGMCSLTAWGYLQKTPWSYVLLPSFPIRIPAGAPDNKGYEDP